MTRPRALDLFCCAGGMGEGLRRAGFDVLGVDHLPQPHHRGEFLQADALQILRDRAFLRTFDFIHASPPCQSHSVLRHLAKGKTYPDHIAEVRFLLKRSGVPWSIENVPGAPLSAGRDSFLIQLCGTMFGLTTPDGRAELRRHRLFETSFYIFPHPECRHERSTLSVAGHAHEVVIDRQRGRKQVVCVGGGKAMSGGMSKPQGMIRREQEARRAISVTGGTPQTNTVHNQVRETFSVQEARHAMGIDWEVPMSRLSQAIPPPYGEFIGRAALNYLSHLPGSSRLPA